MVEFITSATLAALIWYASLKLQLGLVDFALLIAFIQLTGRFFRPIRELAERYNIMQTALASSERIFKLLDNQDVIPNGHLTETPVFKGLFDLRMLILLTKIMATKGEPSFTV